MPDYEIMVSICCLTYNHQKFIRKALDGFLMQKTDFNIEIIMHDDASTDGTREIIEAYTAKYPQLFRLVFQPKNLYTSGTSIYQIYTEHVFPIAKGKYLAICEGDDYWTDLMKLQKQIDFLEQNSDYSICFHNAGSEGDRPTDFREYEKYYSKMFSKKHIFSFQDLIRENFILNCTVVYRNSISSFTDIFDDCIFPDWPLHLIYAQTGKIIFLDDLMAVHFKHENGMWEGKTIETRTNGIYLFYIGLLRYFQHSFYPDILQALEKHTKIHVIPDFKEAFNLGYSLGVKKENENTVKLHNDLNLIFGSRSWKLANLLRRGSAFVFPPASIRGKMGKSIYHFSKKIYCGSKILRQKISGRLIKFDKVVRKINTIKIKNTQWPADQPLVSVIIPNYNYGQYISETIASVLDQTFKNYEVIVVDGGSDDPETLRILSQINHPKINVHLRKGRYMVGNNRNFGIALAKGKYICCLDSDDMIEPTYLEKAIYYLEALHYDVVYPWVQSFGNSDVLWKTRAATYEVLTTVGNVVAVIAVYRKEAWAKCGGYKDYPIGEGYMCEDWEFWTRLSGHGYRFRSIPEALMLYRIHTNSVLSLSKTPIENQREIICNENIYLDAEKFRKLRGKSMRKNFVVSNPHINLKQAKSRKRILIAFPFMITGGVDTHFLNIFSQLAKTYDISIITSIDTPEEYGDNTSHYQKVTPEIYKLPKFLNSKNQMENFIRYLIETKEIDLIFMAGSELTYHCLPKLTAKFPQLKVVDFLFNETDHIINNRKYARYINMNIVENEKIESLLINNHSENPEKIRLIHNWININLPLQNLDKNEMMAKHGLDDGKFMVAFMGRFSSMRNPQAVIEIAKLLRHENIVFFMGGNGPVYSEVIDTIRQNGLEPQIKAPGFVDTQEILTIADVLILPSIVDGRPNIVLEALAASIPVIASNVGGLPTIITDEYNGYLLKHDDINGFAEKIQRLKEDSELLRKMKVNARNYACEHLDDKIMHEKYAAILNQLLEKD